MTRRAVRFALFIVFLAAVAAAGWFGVETVRQTDRDRIAFDALERSVRGALVAAGDARMAVQAHAATDQDVALWRKHLAGDIASLKSQLLLLRQQAGDSSGLNDIDAAAAAVEEFSTIAAHVGRLAAAGESGDASRIVYHEGLDSLSTAITRINAAWDAERTAADARQRARIDAVTYRGLGAGAAALVAVLLLLPTGRKAEREEPASVMGSHQLPATPATPVPGPVASREPPAQPGETRAAAPGAGSPVLDRRKALELKAVADLCTDFARLDQSSELPALLERTAVAIDASGFIVWVANAAGTELTPALAHGYSPDAVGQMPTIPRQSDNATAAAWRNAEMQTVKTNGMTPGALVVPLLTPLGCVGVLAAEVRHGRESSESIRALARIVASQLATLLSPPAAAQAEPLPASANSSATAS